MTTATADSELLKQLTGPYAYRLTPATMAYKITGGLWVPARHLAFIASRIASGIAKGNARIIVNTPPRHGKSKLISVHTPVWGLDRNPQNEVILTSYGAELAEEFSQEARDHIETDSNEEGAHLLRCKLQSGSKRVDRFLTTERGGMRAVGIGGTIVGRGADILLVDDYLKNAKSAQSVTMRNDCYEWFQSSAFTRLEPGGSVIILAQRWDLDDLTGRLLEDGGWDHIMLPAIAMEGDVLGREAGEPLWPERYNLEALETIRVKVGEYFWNALYQQDPQPRREKEVHFPIIDITPDPSTLRCVRSWDLASSEDGGDYTVGTKLGHDDPKGVTYILDVKRAQLGPAGVEQLVETTATEDGLNTSIILEQEPGSAGKIVIDHYVRNVLKGYIVHSDRPTGDKFIRAQPYYAAIDNTLVILKKAAWNAPFISEHRLFPFGDNDDQVDSASAGFNEIHKKRMYAGTFGRDRVAGESDDYTLVTGASW